MARSALAGSAWIDYDDPLMNVADVIAAMEAIAPREYAADWDNVGLLVGSQQWPANAILLTIDLTGAVLQEAIDSGANMIISYHPPIFSAVKSITETSPGGGVVLGAAAAKIAVYSPHTALDAAPGGINDWLAQSLGPGDSRSLQPFSSLPESEQCKIVTFCPIEPPETLDRIRNGLASVGAGRIGKYQLCSFAMAGRGSFFAGEGTMPKVGSRGALQHVEEMRLEMVCSKSALGLAIATLREFHPYEEPAFEIYALEPRPLRHIGQGRRVTLDQPAALKTIVDRIKENLNVDQVEVGVANAAPSKFSRIGVCAGAGGGLLQATIDQGCELFLTGELRHHDVLMAQARGCTVILAGHTNTERGFLKPLRKRLADQLPDTTVAVAKRDVLPLRLM